MTGTGLRGALASSDVVVLSAPVARRAWRLLPLLGREERLRAGRMAATRRRLEYVTGRAVLRSALAPLLGMPPRNVPVGLGPLGRPELRAPLADGTWPGVSLAHAGGRLLLALSRHGDVGVDLEPLRPPPSRLAERCCAPSERAALERLPADRRTAAFLHLWTIKEACAKALGVGIAFPPRRIVASQRPSGRWRGLWWRALDLGPATVASVAVRLPPEPTHRAPSVEVLHLSEVPTPQTQTPQTHTPHIHTPWEDTTVITDSDFRDTVVAALAAEGEADKAPADVTDDTRLDAEGLALNSLGFVRAMVALEDKLDVELEDAVVMSGQLDTIGDVVRLVRETVDSSEGSG